MRLKLGGVLPCVLVVVGVLALSLGAGSASAAGVVGWSVHQVWSPAQDAYFLVVENVGDEASDATVPVTLTDTLPQGFVMSETQSEYPEYSVGGNTLVWGCDGVGGTTVTCTLSGSVTASVPVGGYVASLEIVVAASGGMAGSLRNSVSVSGGGAGVAASSSVVSAAGLPSGFTVDWYGMDPVSLDGAPSVQAGAHPGSLTTGFTTPIVKSPPGYTKASDSFAAPFSTPQDMKSAVAELPLGLLGDPLATARCTESEFPRRCPAGSLVGTYALGAATFSRSPATMLPFSGVDGGCGGCTGVYNIVPEGGYPAEFAFDFTNVQVYLYASVVHGPGGYRLRIDAPGIPPVIETADFFVTFFGDPGTINGVPSSAAFLTNPTDCAAGALSSRLELSSWNSGDVASGEATAYPGVTGCGHLRFEPTLAFTPSDAGEGGSSEVDAPSAYTADVKIPQTSQVGELATPPLKAATVTLPAGVSISPSAAQGLVGCQETGPEGINIGSSQFGALGQDLGDPEATELGAGPPGGDGSRYDDALYHTAPGRCPAASTIGTVEAFTPLLEDGPGGTAPVTGHVYLQAPKCGGAGQPGCTEASATNGELFGVYLELEGDGVILKVPASVAADPHTGRLTATFREIPQIPFSDLKLHLDGGPRAPLANPQSCGAAGTESLFEPWSAPGTPTAAVSSSFSVDWDGQGGACPAGMPFNPGFSAGTVSPSAGAFSAFSLSFSRQDREQDLAGISATLPPGVLGVLKSVPLCGEQQAAQGTCPAASLIGHTTVTAGAGSEPYTVTGEVFLTGAYRGQPFGLSIVVPAVAGPFNLGNVVVRAAIGVDPHTSQIVVTSDPLPQIVDGVPLRVKSVNVTVDRQGFVFNPTNCNTLQVTATITAAQGASANVSSPFTASGCKSLPFKPSFTVSTQASTSKKQGASLVVKTGYPAGSANIASVAVTLPKQLPARLTTIQQACPEAVFDANPASCPAGSDIGTGTASTPILASTLTGPVYLVSHGGAAFPDVVVILQGEGVTVDLTGSIDIKHNVTSSTFASIPDAPISGFTLTLPEGPHSGLAAVVPAKAKGSLCGQNLTMPTTITGQNGAVLKQTTKIAVTGCPKAKVKAKKGKRG
jgi:hypothetical protein